MEKKKGTLVVTTKGAVGVPSGTKLVLDASVKTEYGTDELSKLFRSPAVLKFVCDLVASAGQKPTGPDIVADLEAKAKVLLSKRGEMVLLKEPRTGTTIVLTSDMYK